MDAPDTMIATMTTESPPDPLAELKAETRAIETCVGQLAGLNVESRTKVWRYVTDWVNKTRGSAEQTYSPSPQMTLPSIVEAGTGMAMLHASSAAPQVRSFDTLADLFAVAHPETDSEKALVASAWLQEREGHGEIVPQTVNRELNHLGHKVGNITRAFDALRNAKPNLVVQLRKEGSSKQARKTLKVTVAGLKEVERLLRGEP